jgi:hypothetical protein
VSGYATTRAVHLQFESSLAPNLEVADTTLSCDDPSLFFLDRLNGHEMALRVVRDERRQNSDRGQDNVRDGISKARLISLWTTVKAIDYPKEGGRPSAT